MTTGSGSVTERLGILLTGFIVMWLVFCFLVRMEQFTVEVLGGMIAVIFGGVVLYFIQLSDKKNVWNYPIGLFLGFVVFQICAFSGLSGPFMAFLPGDVLTPTVTPIIGVTGIPTTAPGITGTPAPTVTVQVTVSPTTVPTASAPATASVAGMGFFAILLVTGIVVTALLARSTGRREQPPGN